jgi:hypothetical protein
MAEEIQIQGSGEVGKKRHPLGIIGLMLITLGIYFFVWYYKVNKEMVAIGKARNTDECGDNPTTSLLALIPGFLIIVPPYVSFYNANKRLNAAEHLTGRPEGIAPALMVVLYFVFSPIAVYLFQNNLNKVLEAQAGGGSARPLQAPAQTAATPQQPAPTEGSPPPQA